MRMRKLLIIIITPLLISWIDPFRDEISRGNANYHNKKYEESLKNYEKSSDYAPDKKSRASLAFNRGDARFKLGEYDKAVENFRQSLESEDPDVQKKAFLNMGNSYLQMKKYDEAVEAYVNALKIDPGYEKAKKNLEYMLKKKDQKDKNGGKDDNKDKGSDKKDKDGDNKNSKGDDSKKNKDSTSAKAANKEQIKNILKSMKNKPVRRKKGSGNDTRYLEKYW